MTDIEAITLETEVEAEEAARDIAKAVSARHSIARKYVLRLRRRNPGATPADVIRILERHYATSITTAGAIITAGTIAADVGISLIPGGGAAAMGAKAAGQEVAKKVTKEAAKAAAKGVAKNVALGVAKGSAQRVAALLPAGDQQLQFEITALFGLAIADIHGMELDQDQAHALVYGLTNERVSQQQIATMAADLANSSLDDVVDVGQRIATERSDWSHWATTLSDTLPAGAAQSLVRTVQTGHLDTVRESLSGKQQATIEYGVGALVGGVTRFVFGRDVVASSRIAFPEAPGIFPSHLELSSMQPSDEEDGEVEPNKALAALEEAAKASGNWIVGTAGAVGSGVSSAAGTVTRPFRSVDLDGDGIPDEARALTAVKGVGGSLAGAAGAVGGGVAGLFRSNKRNRSVEEPTDSEQPSQDHSPA